MPPSHPATPNPALFPLAPARTIARPATFAGITLFTGVQSSITIAPPDPAQPAPICFRRADLPPHTAAASTFIPALVSHVIPEARRTILAANPADPKSPSVQTVEHLLSALAGLNITHALIDLRGPEIPIGDGSSKPFTDAILAAGLTTISPPRALAPRTFTITQPITIDAAGARIEALPLPSPPGGAGFQPALPNLILEYHLNYGAASYLPAQQHTFTHTADNASASTYTRDIAPARTFCLAEEALAMREAGLFRHLNPKDMLVIGPAGPIDNAYRFPDEPARHKLLDMLGDLSLANLHIRGRIVATRSGHALNHQMAARLAAAAAS